jgi:hypothetical protein
MPGGFMQISIFGSQDIYLTGNPQITFFKFIFKRHTHFSFQTINIPINDAKFGDKYSIILPRNGDLISKCFIKIDTPEITGTNINYYEETAHNMIKSVELQIGEIIIDKHYDIWFSIWNALTLPKSKELSYYKLIGNINYIPSLSADNKFILTQPTNTLNDYTFYIPLQFWFCRHINLALPYCALQYNDIKLIIEFNTTNKIITDSKNLFMKSASIDIDYIYLDNEERDKFINTSHEYLIEQLQYNGNESLNKQKNIINMDFKNPIKELIWTTTNNSSITNLDFRESLSSNKNPTESAKILLNGVELFNEKNGRYFSEVQPYQHHSNIPHNTLINKTHYYHGAEYTTYTNINSTNFTKRGINVYSFALKPEEIQPTGFCNFSKLDDASLVLNLTDTAYSQGGNKLHLFATSYNVLRISNDVCELLYN